MFIWLPQEYLAGISIHMSCAQRNSGPLLLISYDNLDGLRYMIRKWIHVS